MRVMVIVKASKDSESGAMPSADMVARMDVYNQQLIEAGVMVDGGGLKSTSNAARVRFPGGEPVASYGPFALTSDLIGGYWIWQVKDLADAVEWLKKAPFTDGEELEIRPYFEPEDFAGIATEEVIEKEKGWREAQLSRPLS